MNELIERCESLKHERKQLREDLLNSKEDASSLQIQLDKELRERQNLSDEVNEAKKKIKRREDEIQNLESKLTEQADILEKGNRRSREEQGQMRIVKQELDIQVCIRRFGDNEIFNCSVVLAGNAFRLSL